MDIDKMGEAYNVYLVAYAMVVSGDRLAPAADGKVSAVEASALALGAYDAKRCGPRSKADVTLDIERMIVAPEKDEAFRRAVTVAVRDAEKALFDEVYGVAVPAIVDATSGMPTDASGPVIKALTDALLYKVAAKHDICD